MKEYAFCIGCYKMHKNIVHYQHPCEDCKHVEHGAPQRAIEAVLGLSLSDIEEVSMALSEFVSQIKVIEIQQK